MVIAGVAKVAPVKATEVSAASLYQVNTGLVTVVLDALSVAELPEHTVALFAAMSDASAEGVTVTATGVRELVAPPETACT